MFCFVSPVIEVFCPTSGSCDFFSLLIGPSGVCALDLAAGINVGGHSTWHYFSSFSLLSKVLTFLPEWVVVGFRNFAWAPK